MSEQSERTQQSRIGTYARAVIVIAVGLGFGGVLIRSAFLPANSHQPVILRGLFVFLGVGMVVITVYTAVEEVRANE